MPWGSGGLAQSLSISMDLWVDTLKTRAAHPSQEVHPKESI